MNAFLSMLGAATPSNKVLGDNHHKSQLFGFDKIAVCLSYSNALARYECHQRMMILLPNLSTVDE